jgi:cellobiose phosphorylase
VRFGHFDDENREYVITRPDTPLPWINYLGCEDYFGLISNTAGGYSFYRDARLRRLTRYRYNAAPADVGGRYIYVRDDDTADFWSPGWQPTRKPVDDYVCRHGLGYTVIGSSRAGIRTDTTYFVPLGESLEMWDCTVRNDRETDARLSVFASVEFCLWDAYEDATNFQRNLNVGEVEIDGSVIYHKSEYRERRNHFAYFACSEPTWGFETQREAFLGPYRGWDTPLGVEHGHLCDSRAHGWSPVGVHHVEVHLAPGESRRLLFVLGYHENQPEAKFWPPDSQSIDKRGLAPRLSTVLQPAYASSAFGCLREHWDRTLNTFQIDTPDIHTNRTGNIWNIYQCVTTFNVSRSASSFESGVGRGIGFRDSCQDILGYVHMDTARSRGRILDLAATQLETGGAFHQYQPLTKKGNEAIGSGFSDDPLWLVIATAAYLKESGDWSVLDAPVCFENESGSERPLLEHLRRSIAYTESRLGPHSLPLIGRADWNDCLNLNCFSERPGESFQTTETRESAVAESVFTAALFVLAANEMAEISARCGRAVEAVRYRDAAREMSESVCRHGWDGEWFLRAYDANGGRVGSKDCDEGRIFVETQGLCPIAGIGLENGRAQAALDSVSELLTNDHGVAILAPAFSRYYPHLGEISSYPPGYKENGGVFCHANGWVMIAETRVGNADRAHDLYLRINPSAREHISEVHRCEPYVFAQMISGPESPTPGEAKNSWLTGTASWSYVALTQWLLGIRPTYDGLVIDPCIPSTWAGFTATRKFRGVAYEITVGRATCPEEVGLWVDGDRVAGATVAFPPPSVDHVSVLVRIAKPAVAQGAATRARRLS